MVYLNMIVDGVNNSCYGAKYSCCFISGSSNIFTFKTKFMQFRLFVEIIKILKKDKQKEGKVSS